MAAKYDERLDPWFNRLARTFWQEGGLRGIFPGPDFDTFDANTVASLTAHLIEEAAEIGNCVIVGRASQCILQDRHDTFHAFVYAPPAEKLRRIRGRFPNLSEDEARQAMDAKDRERAAYVRLYFGQDWSNRHLYDLTICSSLGEEVVLATILAASGLSRIPVAGPGRGARHDG